jgi:hypothetical protein
MRKFGKKILHFYNPSGNLENIINFLENIQKKVNYIDLSVIVEGRKTIKITIFGPRDMQYLACDRLKELAERFL